MPPSDESGGRAVPGRRAPLGPRTLVDKLWDAHLLGRTADGRDRLSVDRSLIHERQAPVLARLGHAGRRLAHPEHVVACVDQVLPTSAGTEPRPAARATLGVGGDRGAPGDPGAGSPAAAEDEEPSVALLAALEHLDELEAATDLTDVPVFGPGDPRRGVLHVVAPEQGMTHPGMLVVGADAHTSTLGAFATLALAVADDELEEVLATGTIARPRPPVLRLHATAVLGPDASAKDLVLWILARLGPAVSAGHAVELTGPAVVALGMAGRMTLCNLAVEGGAVTAVMAADDVTVAHLHGRPFAPNGAAWDAAVAAWRELQADPGSRPDTDVTLLAGEIEPHVTWGTHAWQSVPISGRVPRPDADPRRHGLDARALVDQGLDAGTPIDGLAIDRVFIGSCANARIEDLRAAAEVARHGRAQVPALVVPGSVPVKRQAEAEGLHRVFLDAGFLWREPGCSLCVGANGDLAGAGERVVSTANRSALGAAGPGSRTHLVSPAMAAAAAITGRITDVRRVR